MKKKLNVGTGVSPVQAVRRAADKVNLPHEGVSQ
jgi:hypothetical protein